MAVRRDREQQLDRAFLALADPVRRSIVAQLSRGPASVGELAAPHPITVQAVSRHVGVLEAAGLVTRSRDAQRRPVHLDPAALQVLTSWIDRYRVVAEARFRRLDALLTDLQPSRNSDAATDASTDTAVEEGVDESADAGDSTPTTPDERTAP